MIPMLRLYRHALIRDVKEKCELNIENDTECFINKPNRVYPSSLSSLPPCFLIKDATMYLKKLQKDVSDSDTMILPCMDAFDKCYRDIQKMRSSPVKYGQKGMVLLAFIGAIALSWTCNTVLMRRMTYGPKSLRLQQQGNRTIVFLIGNLRCGEPAWESLFKNVLDFNSADLGLVVGASDEKYNDASLWKRAKYVFREKEYDDWGDALGKSKLRAALCNSNRN